RAYSPKLRQKPGRDCRAGFFVARPRARPCAALLLHASRRNVMQFQKGESGNPAGRPRGARNRTTRLLQSLLAERAESIGRREIARGEEGDIAAIRVCVDRLAPALKDEPVDIELPSLEKPADSVAAAAAIVAGVAAGELTPSQAAQLAKVVDVYVRAIETKAFDERLSKVEAAVKSAPDRTWDGAGHGDAGV